jgi:hypothetical protein
MDQSGTPDGALMLQWVFGACIVVFYAVDRFKEPRQDPRPARATTTFWRYWSACCGYVVAMLGLFIVLGGGITEIDPHVLLPLIDSSDVPADAKTMPGPLLSALLLTSLLPHFPTLGKVDAAVKRWFQRVGNIPYEVRELSSQLREASYQPRPEAMVHIAPVLHEFGVDESWLRESDTTLRHRWARNVAMFAHVQRWEATRGFTSYVDQHRTALPDLRTRIARLADLLDAKTLAELDHDTGSRLAAHTRKSIDAGLESLEESLCDFIGGGVLDGAWNHARRRDALAQLGFAGLSPARGPLTSHDLVLVAGLVFLAMLFIPLAMRRFVDPQPLAQSMRVLVMVPMIYAIAIVAAIYPKSMWPYAARSPEGDRPFAAYAVCGLAAVAAAFVVSLIFRFVFDQTGNVFQSLSTRGAFAHAWATTTERWPWLLMTFFITVALAWTADNRDPVDAAACTRLRAIEAVSMAAVFAVLQWTVVQFLGARSAEEAARLAVALPQMMATATTIGALIGWLVPHLHRTRVRLPAGAPQAVAVPATGA